MLLIVIAALCICLVVQGRRAASREAELRQARAKALIDEATPESGEIGGLRL
jgi:hypothetical protein